MEFRLGGYGATVGDPNNITLTNPPVTVGTAGFEANGWFGGGQVGANLQSGAMVLGIEADIQGSGIKDNFSRTIDAADDVLTGTNRRGCRRHYEQRS
jgi:outer membrane immunogenic protein